MTSLTNAQTRQNDRLEIQRKLEEMLEVRKHSKYKSDPEDDKYPIYDGRYKSTAKTEYLKLLDGQRVECELITEAFKRSSTQDSADAAVLTKLKGFLYDIERLARPAKKWIAFCETLQEISAWRVGPKARAGPEGLPPNVIELAKRAAEMIPHFFDPLGSDQEQHGSAKDYFTYSSQLAAMVLEANGTAYCALDVLMYGRGVIADAQIEKRTPLSRLRELAPELATEFERLQDQVDCVRNRTGGGRTCTEASNVRDKLDSLISKIHRVSGLEDFLSRPTEAEVKAAAAGGTIVVINIAFRCDAILIKPGGITKIRLPNLFRSAVHEYEPCFRRPHSSHGATEHQYFTPPANNPNPERTMAKTLNWLWTTVADPILSELGYTTTPATGTAWPRVWWVTTGMLASFPIHAAGLLAPDATGQLVPDKANTVLDRVVSSYSPSVKALIHARKIIVTRRIDNPPSRKPVLFWPPANQRLASAKEEVETVKAMLGSAGTVSGEMPTKQDLSDHLKDCTIFHFSGHGTSSRDNPSKSYLTLNRSSFLTVSDLLALKLYLKPPFLATLSACETGDLGDRALGDEGIHMISAFQLAGFSHVIGSLWSVTDGFTTAINRDIYSAIKSKGFSDESVALSLHNALHNARQIASDLYRNVDPNGGIGNPFLWGSFIHVGI